MSVSIAFNAKSSELSSTQAPPNYPNLIDAFFDESAVTDFHAESGANLTGGKMRWILDHIFGKLSYVEGLGINFAKIRQIPFDQQRDLITRIESSEQHSLSWESKLLLAAAHSSLSINQLTQTPPSNKELIDYLKSKSEPGDILLTSHGGVKRNLIGELFQRTYRTLGALDSDDQRFPFQHVLVNLGDGKILQMNFKGARVTTWDHLFLNHQYYEGITLGRLNMAPPERAAFANEAKNFALGKSYNLIWALLEKPAELLVGNRLSDSSIEDGSCVCIDTVTEPLSILAKQGHSVPNSLLKVVLPIDLARSSGIKLIEAIQLAR